MAGNKTQATTQDVDAFLAAIANPRRREDAQTLKALFHRVTGFPARMWGPSIVGFGRYHYRYDSGREGDFLATGFSPRSAHLAIYIMPGHADYGDILNRLGKHRLGKSCLYINKLSDVDTAVLEELICAGLADLARRWPIEPG